MKLLILRPYRIYHQGQILADVPAGAAEVMIRRGFARACDEETEVAALAPECERAAIQNRHKRRG